MILTYGTLTNEALKAADILADQGIRISVMRLQQIHPLPLEAIGIMYDGQHSILIAEEAVGGIAENLAWHMSRMAPEARFAVSDLGKGFITHGNMASLYRHCGLDAASLADKTFYHDITVAAKNAMEKDVIEAIKVKEGIITTTPSSSSEEIEEDASSEEKVSEESSSSSK